jgi:homoserine dehydrogenase
MAEALRLGLAGLGTVGSSLVQILERHGNDLAVRCGRPIDLVGISARDRRKDRGIDVSRYRWVASPEALARDPEVDVFVELIGGADDIAAKSVRTALGAGKHVVTANKALLAAEGHALARLAEQNRVSLNFEAAVAGGIPIVKTLRESLAGNTIQRVYGILNGTCNYILTRMEREGLSFEACLREAQRLGYAEADPSFDVEGFDTAHKLAILTSIAFGTVIDAESIYVEGISSLEPADIEAADELGYRIKLLGVASRTETGIEQRVHPTMVPKASAIARTASAVIADIADIARGDVIGTFGRPATTLEPYRQAVMRAHEGGYYVRLSVYDRPGAFAAIAKRMAEQQISLESIVQRRRAPRSTAPDNPQPHEAQPVILITYATTEAAMKEALASILADGHIAHAPQMIRIENLN